MKEVVYKIPDFLLDRFTNMDEKDICEIITKALARDSNVTDRLCLDIRIDQNVYFQQVLGKLNDLQNIMSSGVVVSAGTPLTGSGGTAPASISCDVQEKEEKYVALEDSDGDDEDGDWDAFIM